MKIDLVASLKNIATDEFFGRNCVVENNGSRWTVSVMFPGTGKYELWLFGKPVTDTGKSYYGLARWMFDAVASETGRRSPLFERHGLEQVTSGEYILSLRQT